MFYPPTIPINIFSFLILSLFWGGVSYWLSKRSDEPAREQWLFHGLIGVLSSLATLLLLTAFSFVPDDWSANRIAVPLSWLFGYPVYSDLKADPSNCNFYLPFGFHGYLPTALLGYLSGSPEVCLLAGWLQTLLYYFTPIFILIYRFENPKSINLALVLCAIILSLSNPASRYVATMIHVDAVGLFCLGSGLALVLPIPGSKSPSNIYFKMSGVLLGISFFIKQTFIPFTVIIILITVLIYRKKSLHFIVSVISTSLFLLMLCLTFVDIKLMLLYGYEASSSVPSIRSMGDSLQAYFESSWPIMIGSALLVFLSIKSWRFELPLLLLIITSSIFSIYTYTKTGADLNHFILPVYFMIFLILIMISNILSKKFIAGIILIIFSVALTVPQILSYTKTYCGWYHWLFNAHSQAHRFLKEHADESIYFPWQPLASLLAQGKMYHLDQGLNYEEINNVGQRSIENITEYLPEKPFKVAVRPFGAPSFVVDKLSGREIEFSSAVLPNWRIYIIE